ncbi:hypothetical protein ES705_48405 [subsurface metagenome]
MVIKILTLQWEKNRRITKKIKRLREDWKKKVKGHQNRRLEKEKFDFYKEGLIDALGLKKTSELIKLSNFYFT